jgi:hypothetical protein
MKKDKEHMFKYYENMMNNKCYTKGINDSKTRHKVLATKNKNYFNPDDCYFAYINELSNGTCYVDAE